MEQQEPFSSVWDGKNLRRNPGGAASSNEEQVGNQKSNKTNQLPSSGRLTPIQNTISDDRSQGSEFHRNSHILYALERTTANDKSQDERGSGRSLGKIKYVNV